MKTAAVALAKLGWHIFPLAPKSKKPLKRGHGLLDATNDPDKIAQLWDEHPDANIAVNAGASGLAILDVDIYKDGAVEALEHLIEAVGGLPYTVMSATGGGGTQYFFRTEEVLRSGTNIPIPVQGEKSCNKSRPGPGIDFKSSGGYVVLPPSIHPSNTPYRWMDGHTPFDCAIAEIPDALAELRRKKEVKEPDPRKLDTDGAERMSAEIGPVDRDEIIDALKAIEPEDYYQWLDVGMAIKAGLGEDGFDIWDDWSAGSAKHEPDEMRRKWDSFQRDGKTPATVFWLARQNGWAPATEGMSGDEMRELIDREFRQEKEGKIEQELDEVLGGVAPFSLAYMPDEPPPPPDYLIEQILPEGVCAIINGPPKADKTWLELAMVISCVTGERVLDKWGSSGGKRVLLYCPEGGMANLWRRFFGLCWGMQIDPKILQKNIAVIENRINVSSKNNYSRLQETIKVFNPDLLAIDPLISIHRGAENSSDEMQPVLDHIRDLQVDRDLTILLVHHAAKHGPGPRGSSAIDGWWDSKLEVARVNEDDASLRKLEVEHRDGAPVGPVTFKLVVGHPDDAWLRSAGHTKFQLQEINTANGGRHLNPEELSRLRNLIRDKDGKLTRAQGAAELGMKREKFNRYFKHLEDDGTCLLEKKSGRQVMSLSRLSRLSRN